MILSSHRARDGLMQRGVFLEAPYDKDAKGKSAPKSPGNPLVILELKGRLRTAKA